MFCTNCGGQNEPGTAFCTKCGARLADPSTAPAETVPPLHSGSPEIPIAAPDAGSAGPGYNPAPGYGPGYGPGNGPGNVPGYAPGNVPGYVPSDVPGYVPPAAAYGPPAAAYQDPTAKSKLVAGLLGILLGGLGIHRFYLGYTNIGIAQLATDIIGWVLLPFTCGISLIFIMAAHLWGLVDGIMILTGSINTDAQGKPLRD